jgi:hypothetical protein
VRGQRNFVSGLLVLTLHSGRQLPPRGGEPVVGGKGWQVCVHTWTLPQMDSRAGKSMALSMGLPWICTGGRADD